MDLSFEPVAPPLRMDEDGACRVSGTRVTLQTILEFYRMGQTPEQIHDGFPMVPLADVYAVIAYYLNHREALDEYLRHIESLERENIRRMEQDPATQALRERLLAHRRRLAS